MSEVVMNPASFAVVDDAAAGIAAPATPGSPTASLTHTLGTTLGARTELLALTGLTVAAGLVRLVGLPIVQGTMGRDEARLALAARGVLEYGIPLLPGGLVYTRGLLPCYVESISLALFGMSDQAARLPSLLIGTLLIPAVYLLARELGGPLVALAAAAIVAFAQPLVLQSREAWLYPSFLLWFTVTLLLLQRARRRGSVADRALAGLALVAALFSHELAVLLLPIAALCDLITSLRGERAAVRWSYLLAFWPTALTAVALAGWLSLTLRGATLGGSTIEAREYLRPSLDPAGLLATVRILAGWAPWLLPLAVLGLPLLWLSRRPPTLLYLALGVILVFDGFVLVNRADSRYVLMALPLTAIIAACSVSHGGPRLLRWLLGKRQFGSHGPALGAGLLAALVLVSVDPARLTQDMRARAVPETWLQAVTDRQPSDLIVSFAPTLTTHYLGRTDFWIRPIGYEKYVWARSRRPPYVDVHTKAVVIRNPQELERLLVTPNRGRTAWVILGGDPSLERVPLVRDLSQSLVNLAVEQRATQDGRLVLRLEL